MVHPRFEAGYIREESDGWYIEPAENLVPGDPSTPTHARIRINIPSGLKRWHSCKQAYNIYVRCDAYDFKEVRGGFVHIKRSNVTSSSSSPNSGHRPAVLAKTGPVPRKATEAVIFAPSGASKEQWIRIPDGTDSDDPRDLVTAYLDQVTKTGRFNQKEQLGSDQGVLRNHHPVFYVMQGNKLLRFFGHTQMFRMPYRRSPEDLLPVAHSDDSRVDLAEAMFGSARGRNTGVAGRIFVSDAQLAPDQDRTKLWLAQDPVIIPRILSGPKPTTFQHYLVQTNPDKEKGKGLLTYNNVGKTTLRGHKLYWHKGNAPRSAFAEQDMDEKAKSKDTQHTRMKPVRDGVRFRFRVRFENLLSQELGLLLWSLKLGQATMPESPQYVHKLGMGKPLGLGSVWLKPTLTLIDFNNPRRYQSFLTSNGDTLEQGFVSDDLTRRVEETAVSEFEQLVAKATKVASETPLASMPRMRQLLAMLSWPGPNPGDVRYMSIGLDETTGKMTGKNEFRDRPVLPDPLGVTTGR
ncbi:MAG: TIGR03986 family CRISPR-associated RAMP protein [Chloroflexota bacterium]